MQMGKRSRKGRRREEEEKDRKVKRVKIVVRMPSALMMAVIMNCKLCVNKSVRNQKIKVHNYLNILK